VGRPGHLKIDTIHRFAPGMYAVDRSRLPEVLAVLREAGFSPAGDVRSYPGDPGQVEARNALHSSSPRPARLPSSTPSAAPIVR
jgi:hypothetical protein